MAHRPLLLQALHIGENTAALDVLPVAQLIHTVEKAEIRIVDAHGAALPLKGLLHPAQLPRPAVFSPGVIDRPEMQRKIHRFPPPADGASERLIHRRAAGAQVKEVDALLQRLPHHRLNFGGRSGLNAAHAQPQRADALLAVGQLSILHHAFSNSFATSFSSARIARC